MLKDADPQSVYNAAMTAASMQLPINPNLWFAYIIPYQKKKKEWDKRVNDWPAVAQFQMWYKGFKQLALRSDQFVTLNASDVREWEMQNYDRLSGEISFDRIQDNDERMKKDIIGYVSNFKLKSWFCSTLYMTIWEIDKHAKKYSQSYKKWYWLWKDDKEAMSLKTVTKLHLSKSAPLSIDMQRAIVADQAIISEDNWSDIVGWVEYPDNPPIEPETKNTIDVWLYEDRKSQLDNCKTIEDVSSLYNQNKPTDKNVLDLFTQRKNAINKEI